MCTNLFSGFLGCSDNYIHSDAVILGAPMDQTVTFRAGSRTGPREIRNTSEVLEEYSPRLDRDLADYCYYDMGDVLIVPGMVEENLERIAQKTAQVLRDNKLLIMLGGEHLVSLPAVKSAADLYPNLSVVHFDAHADLRDHYMGIKLSHATVMKRITEKIGGHNLFQFGIRSGTREEFVFARSSVNLYRGVNVEDVSKTVKALKGRPVYITLDIDVLDPAYAPGTGTPEPDGCTPGDLFAALEVLADLNIVGIDLVEVCPACDETQRTAVLAAKLVREAILLFTNHR